MKDNNWAFNLAVDWFHCPWFREKITGVDVAAVPALQALILCAVVRDRRRRRHAKAKRR